jgi:hypothetical protein
MSSQRKTIVTSLFILSFSFFLFVAEAAAQFTQQKPGKAQPGMVPGMAQARPAAKSNETYSIVQVGRDYQIVTASTLKALKKSVEDENKAAEKAYQLAKKDKNNKGVTLPKPEKRTVKPVPGKTGYKTHEKAEDELQKLLLERDKGGRKSVK